MPERPHFGCAERYYAECSGLRVLDRIPVPTLLVHAADDPWIPVCSRDRQSSPSCW